MHGHSSGVRLLAPYTFTRAGRGCLRHARLLELGALTCPYAVTASGSPPLLDFACHPLGRGRLVLRVPPGALLPGRPCFAVGGGWQIKQSPQNWGLGGRCGSLLEAQLVWNWYVWIQIARLVRAAAFVVGLGA